MLKNGVTVVTAASHCHVWPCVSGLEAGAVGLVLTYAVTLIGNFQWTVRQSAEVENMVRAEPLTRCQFFSLFSVFSQRISCLLR